jgi:hypothetical protein
MKLTKSQARRKPAPSLLGNGTGIYPHDGGVFRPFKPLAAKHFATASFGLAEARKFCPAKPHKNSPGAMAVAARAKP